MTDRIKQGFDRMVVFGQTEPGRRLLRILKYVLQAVIVFILIFQIISIGWRNILSELPTHPLYYLIFLLIYFALPVTEFFTYRIRWPIGFWPSQEIFLKKRVYNKVVLGYSGEVQLFFWFQNQMGIERKEAYEVVRDNNILSTLASTLIVLLLFSVFAGTGRLSIHDWIDYEPVIWITVILAILLIGIFLFRKYRSYLFSMNRRHAVFVFSLHTGRMLLLTVFQVAQWYVVMPWVSIDIWFTMIVLQLVLGRIPFLPNKDLVFIGSSLEFARHVDVSVAGIAGLLLVNQVLDKMMNLLVFSILSVRDEAQRQ